jgi:hypothetical protein
MGMMLPILLLVLLAANQQASAIGVNYGANGDNLPAPDSVASFIATKTTIGRVKLFDANPAFLSAFAANAPSVSLAVCLPNSALPALADRRSGLDAARGWVRDNLSPHVPGANVTLLLAGNEVLGPVIDPKLMVALLPAMRRLDQALKAEGLSQVRVTTPHYLGILAPSDGIPSNAAFRPALVNKVLAPMLRFHRATGSPLMVNAYPYFSYNGDTIDYAIFRPNRGVYDPATKLNYTSMLDAQIDAVYTAMKKLGFGRGVQIAIGEAGWPTKAEPGQAGVGVQEAKDFNTGLIRVCSGGKGTPLMQGKTFEAYIFSLFDENQKPGPIAERNWGIFNTDFTPKYDLGLLRQGPAPSQVSLSFFLVTRQCVKNCIFFEVHVHDRELQHEDVTTDH